MKKLLALLSVTGVLLPLLTPTAQAAPPPAVYKTADGEIVQHTGLTASQQVEVEYPSIAAKKKIKANFCGIVVVPNSPSQPIGSSLKVGADTINVTGLSTQSMPRCENNVLAESRSTNFKMPNGGVAVVGKSAGMTYEVEFVGSSFSKDVRANSCGVLVLKPTAALPIGSTIKLNGTTHTVSTLPTDQLPVCRNVNGTATRYNPSNW